MTLRFSSGLRNFVSQRGSLKRALQGGKILVYSGSQPTTADAAPSGTLLCTFTNGSAAHTSEVQATGSITLTGGASGSVNTLTVDGHDILGGAVAYNTSLNQTAADIATAINNNVTNPGYTASASGAVVTITALPGSGTAPNTHVVTASLTTITATYVDMAGGVASANGLKLGTASAGVISKDASQAWTGLAVATGAAGWFRFVGPVADSGAADADESQIRVDGAISTSGAQLNMTSTTITTGSTQTISSFAFTLPNS